MAPRSTTIRMVFGMGLPIVALFCIAFAPSSGAQTYPDRPIRLVVPFSAGSNNDVIARLVAEHMSKTLKQSIVIDNRVGAGGIVGATNVARQNPMAIRCFSPTRRQCRFSPFWPIRRLTRWRTFLPISTIGRTALILVVSAKSEIRSVKDLIGHIRKKRCELRDRRQRNSHASRGRIVRACQPTQFDPIPYRGSPEMTTAVLSGDVRLCSMVPQTFHSSRKGP